MLLLQQMMVLFIYIAIGYGAAKMGAMDEEFSKKISWLVVNVANLALTISAVVNGDGTIKGKELLPCQNNESEFPSNPGWRLRHSHLPQALHTPSFSINPTWPVEETTP